MPDGRALRRRAAGLRRRAQPAPPAQEARSSGLRHALIIDDEPDVAASLSDILELMGVKSRVVTAWTSAADAARRL